MDTQKEILAYLHKQENKWVTSNELAEFLRVYNTNHSQQHF